MSSKKVYLVGVFDMIHIGHLRLIETASKFGDLYVGVVCDEAVKRVKGDNRPIISQYHRLAHIQKNKDVYECGLIKDFEITEQDINSYDTIIVGADQEHVKGIDLIPIGKRYNLPRTEGVSSSDIIKKIKGQ